MEYQPVWSYMARVTPRWDGVSLKYRTTVRRKDHMETTALTRRLHKCQRLCYMQVYLRLTLSVERRNWAKSWIYINNCQHSSLVKLMCYFSLQHIWVYNAGIFITLIRDFVHFGNKQLSGSKMAAKAGPGWFTPQTLIYCMHARPGSLQWVHCMLRVHLEQAWRWIGVHACVCIQVLQFSVLYSQWVPVRYNRTQISPGTGR